MLEFFRRRARDKFARQLMGALVAQGATDFTYDPESFTLKSPTAVANLANTYAAWRQANGPHKRQLFDNFVAAFSQQCANEPVSWDEAQGKLVAVIRERLYYAAVSSQVWNIPGGDPNKCRPAFEPCSDWFARGLVLDSPTHATIVNDSELKRWGVTFDEAFAIGLAKLRSHTTPKFSQEKGVFVGQWNDDYDSSRILLPELFQDLPIHGEIVVCIPNRLSLLVAGSADHAAMRVMLTRADAVVRTIAKPQNPGPLVLRDGAFVDFIVEDSSPIFPDVDRARHMTALGSYAEQKANLEHAYQKQGRDIFVANYTLVETDRKDLRSYAVWTKGVATLLPEAEEIFFIDGSLAEEKRLVARARFSDAAAIVGDLMLDTKMFPPRHYVSKFPTAEQLAKFEKVP